MNTFETFNNGKLITPATTKDFLNIPWSKHSAFTGVELNHIPDLGRNWHIHFPCQYPA